MKNFTLGFCPKIFLRVTLHVGESGKILGQKVDEKYFRVDPGQKIQKSEKKILFSGRLCFEKLKQYLGGLAIFHKPLVCKGLWKIDKPPKFQKRGVRKYLRYILE